MRASRVAISSGGHRVPIGSNRAFPFLLPLILVLPLWTVGWVEREQGTGKFALTILAALIAVPVAVFGAFFLVRGGG